jgi:hypothetical protein
MDELARALSTVRIAKEFNEARAVLFRQVKGWR